MPVQVRQQESFAWQYGAYCNVPMTDQLSTGVVHTARLAAAVFATLFIVTCNRPPLKHHTVQIGQNNFTLITKQQSTERPGQAEAAGPAKAVRNRDGDQSGRDGEEQQHGQQSR